MAIFAVDTLGLTKRTKGLTSSLKELELQNGNVKSASNHALLDI